MRRLYITENPPSDLEQAVEQLREMTRFSMDFVIERHLVVAVDYDRPAMNRMDETNNVFLVQEDGSFAAIATLQTFLALSEAQA